MLPTLLTWHQHYSSLIHFLFVYITHCYNYSFICLRTYIQLVLQILQPRLNYAIKNRKVEHSAQIRYVYLLDSSQHNLKHSNHNHIEHLLFSDFCSAFSQTHIFFVFLCDKYSVAKAGFAPKQGSSTYSTQCHSLYLYICTFASTKSLIFVVTYQGNTYKGKRLKGGKSRSLGQSRR